MAFNNNDNDLPPSAKIAGGMTLLWVASMVACGLIAAAIAYLG